MADTITLTYTPSGGGPVTAQINILIEKGLTRPEKFRMYPAIQNSYLDGSSDTQYQAFIRSANIRTDVLTDAQLKNYIYWCLDNSRTIDYSIGGVTESGIVLNPSPDQETQRYDDFVGSPYIEFNIEEGVARTTFPV
jgi:hypothetical protein